MQKEYVARILKKYRTDHMHPFVIEVLGTPNAGKTPAIKYFEELIKQSDVNYRVIYEVGKKCKVKEKLSPEFNMWTLNETISNLLDAYTSACDIIICERGLMDAICWFLLYYQNNMLNEEEFHVLHEYITLKRLTKYEDCCFVMKCGVETSLNREYKRGLMNGPGRIVNSTILHKYNSALDQVIKRYGHQFKKVLTLDTSSKLLDEANSAFVSIIIDYLETQIQRF